MYFNLYLFYIVSLLGDFKALYCRSVRILQYTTMLKVSLTGHNCKLYVHVFIYFYFFLFFFRDAEKRAFKDTLIQKLRDVMLHLDLDTASSRQIRQQLENEMMMNLKEYRGFLDQQMLYIVGQLEEPSKIHEYLYLVRINNY